jgi:TPP-dependent pyruvate/acetoin dehydrogenase alpha subunit
MNNHFASRSLDEKGNWKNLTTQKNVSADISPTAGQMPRLLGLALASKLFRNNPSLSHLSGFSISGNEIAFGTIGDASTSEGHFWETINAAGVLQVPLLMSVWDDGYGISVSRKNQTVKDSISKALKGFEAELNNPGIRIFCVKGWDYPALIETYRKAEEICRNEHTPVLLHVIELTQPLGHSTSGSHERYKNNERLRWESEFDGLKKMREWILKEKLASEKEIEEIEKQSVNRAREARKNAWENYRKPLLEKRDEFLKLVNITDCNCAKTQKIDALKEEVERIAEPTRKDLISSGRKILRLICDKCTNPHNSLKINVTEWLKNEWIDGHDRYSSNLYSESAQSALKIIGVAPAYSDKSQWFPGREILKANFDKLFEKYPESLIFGEDVGKIGGVNQTLEGLQSKYGEDRITDTGIREASIIGQGIGLAMRGLRPIAEIQYFDYLLYGLQIISDDLATLQYRTKGGQKAP